MPRFLHTADWQIGRRYAQFDADDAVPLAEARLAAVERLAALAAREGVDAVLVAGDVFDAQAVSERTLRQLFNALAGFAGRWILLPGNHDAALAESVWTQALRLGLVPPHAVLALRPEPIVCADRGFVALPAPLTQRHTYADATQWFDAAETPPSLVRVGLAHGSVQGLLADGIDATNPIAADRAASARLDYLALGDWHGTRRVDARTWYAGTPEPDRFRNNDAGNALLVEIDAPGAPPRVTAAATARFRWQAAAHAIEVPSDVDAVLDRLAALAAHDVLQIELTGRVDLDGDARLRRALAMARAACRALVADLGGLRLAPSADDIAALQADGYLGEVIAELRDGQQQPGADGERAADALALLAGLLADRRAAAAPAP